MIPEKFSDDAKRRTILLVVENMLTKIKSVFILGSKEQKPALKMASKYGYFSKHGVTKRRCYDKFA